MDTWVAQGGQRYGPYSQEKLQELLSTGQIAPGAQVWIPETMQWVNAQDLPGYQRPAASSAMLPDSPGSGSPAAPDAASLAQTGLGPEAPEGQGDGAQAPGAASPHGPAPGDPDAQASGYGAEGHEGFGQAPGYGAQPPAGAFPYGPAPGSPGAQAPGHGAGAPYPPSSPSSTPPPATNQMAVAALVVGVASVLSLLLIITVVLAPVPAALGVLAIVLGFVGRSQVKRTGQQGSGMAIGGIVTGALTLLVLAALVVLAVFGIMRFSEEIGPAINRACSNAVQTDLRNAASTQELILLETQSYTRRVPELRSNGWVSTAESSNCATSPLTIERATERDYCMEMAGGGEVHSITPEGLRAGSCQPLG